MNNPKPIILIRRIQMSKRLFKVKFINQLNGLEEVHYVVTSYLQKIDDEYSDIITIEPLETLVELK